jgi:hypothetical protein
VSDEALEGLVELVDIELGVGREVAESEESESSEARRIKRRQSRG